MKIKLKLRWNGQFYGHYIFLHQNSIRGGRNLTQADSCQKPWESYPGTTMALSSPEEKKWQVTEDACPLFPY